MKHDENILIAQSPKIKLLDFNENSFTSHSWFSILKSYRFNKWELNLADGHITNIMLKQKTQLNCQIRQNKFP